MADRSHRPSGERTGSRHGRGSSRSDARATRSHGGRQARAPRRGGAPAASRAPRMPQADFAANSNRAFIPIMVFAILALAFFGRLMWLQVIDAPRLSAEAEQARTLSYPIEPRRGTIYDRNGTVLATSVDAVTIYADPTKVEDVNGVAASLAQVLGGEAKDYLSALTADKTHYSVIKTRADVDVADKIKALKLKGIEFQQTTRREYPNGRVGGQVIGACSLDVDTEANREYYKGITGLELYYNDILSGEVGYYEAERGRDGTPIPGGEHEVTPAVDGQDIIISLDIELQQYVEDRLLKDKEGLTSNGGSSVVMDAATGEIYAAASLPLFNPADRSDMEEDAPKLKCVTDLFEPGSIFKSVSAMAVLESGTMTPESELFCPATLEADGYVISDAHDRGDATFTLQEIMDQSSNIGISLATENASVGNVSGFQNLYNRILAYNLHEKTGVDFPGEGEEGTDVLGYMLPFDQLSRVQAYNVSFGQGISVTPLQMTRFYGALANDGVECTPHFLISKPQSGETVEYPTENVVENKAAIDPMVDMLKTVVTDGTGKDAAIEGYQVAGKTSTAEIYDEENGGYRKGVYNMAFTGFIADSTGPQLVCFVGANETEYGSIVTPVFRDIMSAAIDRFQILPE